MSTECEEITISDSTAVFSNIAVESVGDNTLDPFKFNISESITDKVVQFNLHITESQGAYTTDITLSLFLSMGKILIVVDDGKANKSEYYTSALENLNIPYEIWRVEVSGEVPKNTLMEFDDVIWFTGKEAINTLTAADQENQPVFRIVAGG